MKKIAEQISNLTKRIEAFEAQSIIASRARYIPPDAKKITPKNTDAEIYIYNNTKGEPSAVAFSGRRNKPDWMYRFRNDGHRDQHIKDYVKQQQDKFAQKQKEKEERKTFRHDLEVGDFVYSSWGYDQTNVNFYQVVSRTDKSVNIREVANKIVKSNPPQDYVVPVKNKFIGKELKNKRVNPRGYITIDSVQSGYKWDGRPKYETSSGWGH